MSLQRAQLSGAALPGRSVLDHLVVRDDLGNRRLRRGWGRPVLPSLLNVVEIDGLLGLYLDPHPVAG